MHLKSSVILIIILISNPVFSDNTLVISNGATRPPMHTENFDGFIDLVLKEALHRIGYKLDSRGLPNERSLINTNRGIIDGEAQRIAGMEKKYPNLIRVQEKIMDWQFVAFSKQKIDTTAGWKSLTSYTASFIMGWKIFEYNVPKQTSITTVQNEKILFNLLKRDRIDVVLYELWQGLELIKSHNYTNIELSTPPLTTREMFTYLHKKHAHLAPKLAQALKKMKHDGTYNQLYNRTLGHLKVIN